MRRYKNEKKEKEKRSQRKEEHAPARFVIHALLNHSQIVALVERRRRTAAEITLIANSSFKKWQGKKRCKENR
jgi:hypothetical protein